MLLPALPKLNRRRFLPTAALAAAALLIATASAVAATTSPAAPPSPATLAEAVAYESFGAIGDGVADDLPAIVAAHAHANAHGLPVRTRPGATYHLGARALTAVIQTDTDWNASRFIIDDNREIENAKLPLFEVRSRLAPVPLEIERLTRGQTRLESRSAAPRDHDLLVLVENDKRRLFIRRGLNPNAGTPQREVFILRRDGTIEGGIDWDYETVTRVEARPIDPEPLVIRGGVFTQTPNRVRQEKGSTYWARNITIKRSNTEVDGITLHLVDEGDYGQPYGGFLRPVQAANITFRNCRIPGRKVYNTIGRANLPVAMGTYGYNADLIVNFRMLRCTMENIDDTSRWGVAASNFMKNVLVEDCVLSRMDVHQGVSGYYILRRSTLGHQGIQAVGRGLLLVEDTTLHCSRLISFRADYGSPWDGEVVVRNSRWVPPPRAQGMPAMFTAQNDGTHDFGYPCSMPRVVRIEGLQVDDAWTLNTKKPGVSYFGDPLGEPRDNRPFPYRLTERIEVSGLKTASGIAPIVSPNPELVRVIELVKK